MFHMKPIVYSDAINRYIELLKEYNETTNIYSKSAYDKLDFHIQDCITLASLIGNPTTLVDMGSGSGLPSVILAIMHPKCKVIAVESKGRKAAFLNLVKSDLELSNFEVIQEDINQVMRTHKLKPHIITAKAFAPYDKAIEIASKIAAPGCELWIPISQVQHEALSAIPKPGFKLVKVEDTGFFYLKKKWV